MDKNKPLISMNIALKQLGTAIRLFTEGKEYISAITLAGAAEEIIGKNCREKGIETSLDSLKKKTAAMFKGYAGSKESEKSLQKMFLNKANFARNKSKHVNPIVEPSLKFDSKEEACHIIIRAIDNYEALGESLTPEMEAFNDENHIFIGI